MEKKRLHALILADTATDPHPLIKYLTDSYDLNHQLVHRLEDLESLWEQEPWEVTFAFHPFDVADSDLSLMPHLQDLQLSAPLMMLSTESDTSLISTLMTDGAADVFLQSDFTRLLPAIEREMKALQQRQQAQEMQARYASIFQASPMGIVIITLDDGRLLEVNPRFEAITGMSRARLLGQRLSDLGLWQEGSSIMEQVVREQEAYLRSEDGSFQEVMLWTAQIVLGGETCILAMIQDSEQMRRVQQAERRQRRLAEIQRDIAFTINSSLEIDEVLQLVLTSVEHLVHYDAADLMLLEEGIASIKQRNGYRIADLEEIRFPLESTPTLQKVRDSLQPLIIGDVHQHPDWQLIPGEEWICSYLVVPIFLKQEVIGFLGLLSRERDFYTPEDATQLQTIALHAANAIHNARLFQNAQELAALEERQRIARDLHDAVTQSLFSSSIMAETLLLLRDKDPALAPYSERLETIHTLNRGALAQMRNLLVELRPEVLGGTDLQKLLKQLVQAVQGRSRIDLDFQVRGNAWKLPKEVKNAFYRIGQEALNNVMKHARATLVVVVVEYQPEGLQLSVQDDGIGFEVPPLDSSSIDTIGLISLQERADAIGAALTLQSSPGEGTLVQVSWQR